MRFVNADYCVTFTRREPEGEERVVSRYPLTESMLTFYVHAPNAALEAARIHQVGFKATGFHIASRKGIVVLRFESGDRPQV